MATNRRFFVTATADIDERIRKGDHVLIDPDKAPQVGKMVLAGDRVDRWDGKEPTRGAMVGVLSPE